MQVHNKVDMIALVFAANVEAVSVVEHIVNQRVTLLERNAVFDLTSIFARPALQHLQVKSRISGNKNLFRQYLSHKVI